MKIIALESRVGQRFALIGVIFILLPVALFSFYISSRIENDLNDAATVQLQKNAKAIGMDIIGQLQHADELLHLFTSQILQSKAGNGASYQVSLPNMAGFENIENLAFINSDNSSDIIKGSGSALPAIVAKITHSSALNDRRPMIISGDFSDDDFQVFLVRPVPARDNQVRWLVAGLSNDYLFGFSKSEAAELICVIPFGGSAHFCNRMSSSAWLEQLSVQTNANRGSGSFVWSDNTAEKQVTGYWSLPLNVSYVSDSWVIAVLTPLNNLAANSRDYKIIVLVFGGLVVLPLFLVIIGIIRRYLNPLVQLTKATRLLAKGDFDTRVLLHSEDEFEEMGAAFNDMAVQLGEQFFYKNILATLSLDLKDCTEVDSGISAVVAALFKIPGTFAFNALIMPGFSSENIYSYRHSIANDNADISILSEVPSKLPMQLWSGSCAEMTATFPGFVPLCSQPTDTVVLLPVLVDQDVKVVLAFNSEASSIDDRMVEFLLQLADFATSSYRDLSRQLQLRHQAEHDVLTDLPNRNLLNDTASQAIQNALENNDCCGLIIFDIDRFKLINDAKGHLAGDELLRQVAERLVNNSYGFSLVSRMAGDEFVILLSGLVSSQAKELVSQAMQHVISIFNAPFVIGNWQVPVSCSVGATICPQDGTSFFELLQHADTAMYSAKNKGLGKMAFYTQKLEDEVQQQLALENDLRNDLLKDQLVVHYQPVVDLEGQRVAGAEALVRWQHPERGLLSPFFFLEVAEKMGVLPDIGKWVLDKVLDDLRRWRSQGHDLSFVAVNVSGPEFSQDGFVEHIIETVDSYGMSSSDIELELTETEVIVDMENGVRKINELREAGFHVSLDDFGTGYSSMEYLKMISVDKVKVDRTFVKDLEESAKDRIIVKALYTLANEMNLSIVAEGVETKPQLDIVQEQGIKLIQGYYFSQPLPETSFLDYLTAFGK